MFSFKSGSTFNIALPLVARGTKVTLTVKTPDGKSIALPAGTQPKVGRFVAPTFKLTLAGSYTFSISFGKSTRQLLLKVTK